MNNHKLRSFLLRLAVAAALYVFVLARWGYEYGRNDQMQTLSYAMMLHHSQEQSSQEQSQHPSQHGPQQGSQQQEQLIAQQDAQQEPELFPKDFYLRGIDAHVPNERYVFSALLAPFVPHLPLVSIICHALFALLLFGLLDRIAALFIHNEAVRWLALLVLFIPLYGVNLGGNELYYNSFFVSNVVKTIGLVGIWMLLRRNYLAAFGLFAGCTFLQPVVGIQLYGMGSFALLLGMLAARAPEPWQDRLGGGLALGWPTWITANLIWLFTAGVWVILLRANFEAEELSGPDHFFEILYIFRSPHHYWPPSWGLKSWLVIVPIVLAGAAYYRRREAHLYGLFLAGILAGITYTAGMLLFRPVWLGALQGFKPTIWLEAFGVIALGAMVQPLFWWLERPFWKRSARVLFFGTALALLGLLRFGYSNPDFEIPIAIPWDRPLNHGRQFVDDPAVDIAVKAQDLLPVDALVAHPLSFTELKVYGQRSAYVDYKVLVHTRAGMAEWQRRIRELYGIAWDLPLPVSERQAFADAYFSALGEAQLDRLAAEGVTHLLTFADADCPRPLVAGNSRYAIYTLEPEVTGGN